MLNWDAKRGAPIHSYMGVSLVDVTKFCLGVAGILKTALCYFKWSEKLLLALCCKVIVMQAV